MCKIFWILYFTIEVSHLIIVNDKILLIIIKNYTIIYWCLLLNWIQVIYLILSGVKWYILHLLKYLTFFSLNVKLFFLHDQSYPQLALGHNIFKFAFINTILIFKIIFNCIWIYFVKNTLNVTSIKSYRKEILFLIIIVIIYP